MSVVLTFATNKPVVKLGRMGGQFAKPRSSDFEEKNGQKLPSYRGDIINSFEFNESSREPDPKRMIRAYNHSASTLNLLRAFADGGYADLKHVQSWNMGFVQSGKQSDRYRHLAESIQESLTFMEALGINANNTPQLRKVDYFTSHEALLLPYEQSLTRVDSTSGKIYNTSAHFLWIGDRTRFIDSAHVEFCRGVENPIGIKCGPSTDTDELNAILDLINPMNEDGKITLITRFGEGNVDNYLPNLIRSITREGKSVIWSCDPMHGNTIKSQSGKKTRAFDSIVNEVKQNFQIHKSEGSRAGGIHLEMTGQDVTECIGGSQSIGDSDLNSRYHTHCDPRLNANQAIELAFLISDWLTE